MHNEYDPDDNFARSFESSADIDEDATVEVLAWQLLLLINPGDEATAQAQFDTARERLVDGEDAVDVIRDAIDWQSGFHVDATDPAAAIDALEQLAARYDIRIDWGVEDAADAEFLDDIDVPGVIGIAFEQVREHHYTLWTWDAGHDHHAGWITRQHDDEALPLVADALGFRVRPGSA